MGTEGSCGSVLTRHPVSALCPLFSSPPARTQPYWAMRKLTTLRDDRVGGRGGLGPWGLWSAFHTSPGSPNWTVTGDKNNLIFCISLSLGDFLLLEVKLILSNIKNKILFYFLSLTLLKIFFIFSPPSFHCLHNLSKTFFSKDHTVA